MIKMNKLESLAITSLLFLAGCVSNNSYLASRNIVLNNKTYSVRQNELKQETNHFDQIKFGVVSDIHNKIEKAEKVAERFKKIEGLDAIIIAGDTAKTFLSLINFNEKKQIKDSLIPFLEIGKPVYVIAGNHETKNAYFSVMKRLAKQYDNLFDLATLKYADLKGVNIFGVSGGNPSPIGGFSLEREINNVDNTVFNLDKDPVLMITHLPPRFNHSKAIDCIYDVKKESGRIIKNRHKGEKAIYKERGIKRINPRNRGEGGLRSLIINWVDFSISGHYHLNEGANNLYKNILPGTFVYKLFMNPGACQYNMAGILTIKGDKAKYELLRMD